MALKLIVVEAVSAREHCNRFVCSDYLSELARRLAAVQNDVILIDRTAVDADIRVILEGNNYDFMSSTCTLVVFSVQIHSI